MLGICGEYIIESTNTTDNIVDKIKKYEMQFSSNNLPTPFVIKKIGILVEADCTVKINGRPFIIKQDSPLEIGYNIMDIFSIVSDTSNVKLTVRYLY